MTSWDDPDAVDGFSRAHLEDSRGKTRRELVIETSIAGRTRVLAVLVEISIVPLRHRTTRATIPADLRTVGEVSNRRVEIGTSTGSHWRGLL